MQRKIIHTDQAPAAIGTYSQAVQIDRTVYVSGQIPLDAQSGEMVSGDIESQVRKVFENMEAIAKAAGGDLNSAVKYNVFLVDLDNFAVVNKVMEECLSSPFPARAAVQVAALPKGAQVEVDAVLVV